ncbi:uncharacterized protein CBL_09742 [Carabus blaptoides fortunei]
MRTVAKLTCHTSNHNSHTLIIHSFVEAVMRFLLRLVYGGPGERMPPIKNLLLLESASSLALKIRTKKISSVEVVNSFIDRIAEVNPVLNCVVDQRYEQARADAAKADALISSGSYTEHQLAEEKPFLGVPFTTKDCIAVKDMIHTSGLHKRRNIIAEQDADAINNMRKSGAIPIGLTNVSELCMWWESNNPVHGRTHNPYNTNHIVGGSSGGEGCAQAAAASAFGIGSDIGGSIRMPAFFNGVFGHKPSKHIVSNKGQYPVPFTPEQNLFLGVGPICRRAEDLVPILKVIAGDNAKLLKLDEKVDVKDIKFFYQENDMGSMLVSNVHPDIKESMHKVVSHLEQAHKLTPQKLENKRFRKSIQMWLALEKGGVKYGSEEHEKLIHEKDQLLLELADTLGTDGVLLYPTHPTPAPYHIEPLFKPFNFSYTAIINLMGFPATHVPLGLSRDGLPIGIQVVANVNQDRLCLAVARELEKAFGGWIPPYIEA